MKYFVELKTPEAVERVSALLADLAIIENWLSDQKDTLGAGHDVCEIPSFVNMRRIYAMVKQDKRVRVAYWKREETGGAHLEPADFLVRDKPVIGRTVKFKSAAARLKAIKEAKSAL
ncbi:MAG: hypothetical protein WA082_00150 [Candidatus Moraniibacteriota bacterium]